jgi:deoxyadenosine/deoxycytidine kinase
MVFDECTILYFVFVFALGACIDYFIRFNYTKNPNKGKVYLVSIEGNISSGKSTIVKILKERTKNNGQFMIVDEPIDIWESIIDNGGNSIFHAFYENPTELGFTFQICALFTRFKSLSKIYDEAMLKSQTIGKPIIVLIERTVLTDYHIFAKMLRKANNMTEFEMLTYKLWFDEFSEKFVLNKSVYLKVSPEICLQRVSVRSRDGEDKINLQYLQACHEQHEEFYKNVLSFNNCMVIDNEKEMNSEDYEKNVTEIIEHFL